ncbi:MAG: ABC transporter permease, partial [Oscillospiraceae bacterium]|nr:ABC transporter permease [Oscillospiraceae bacterium]
KVTARNIFRYKKRFLMTLIGIAGCSALLLTAFGLRDSISGVSALQFGEIVKYDTRAFLKDIRTDAEYSEIVTIIDGEHLFIREESVDAKGEGGDGLPASVIVPEFYEKLTDYFNLRSPKTGASVPFRSDSVLVTDKLARVMGVSVGDEFSIVMGDGKTVTVFVTDIVENYVMHHIYMTGGVYAELFGVELYPNSVLCFTDDGSGLAEKLLDNSDVRGVMQITGFRDSLRDSTDALGIVTLVLIILACSLAFVVLFNLTNINISERIRELATIKVLGFYDSDLALYVYRENGAVTGMGIALGLLLGIVLHKFILVSVEIDLLKFPAIILPQSYIYAVALSALFAVFVNLVMNVKLKGIDMVESLKNVE